MSPATAAPFRSTALERSFDLLTSNSGVVVVAATAEGIPTKRTANTVSSAAIRRCRLEYEGRCVRMTMSSFGGWAISLETPGFATPPHSGCAFFRAWVSRPSYEEERRTVARVVGVGSQHLEHNLRVVENLDSSHGHMTTRTRAISGPRPSSPHSL